MDNPVFDTSRVIIIGGGFSGIAVAANLIRQATHKLHIYIIEKTENLAKGVAYSTAEPFHLLNVPGNNMGLFADNPNHFIEWLEGNSTLWRPYDEAFKTLPIDPGFYYPRKLYGLYLQHLWHAVLAEAACKGIEVTVLNDEALDADITANRTAVVTLKNNPLPEAQHVVIATGNTPVKSFSYANGIFLCKEKYIENIWSAHKTGILNHKNLSHLPKETHIVIVGTGLTMVDAFLSLRRKEFRGKITAISRHGKLPHPHQPFKPYHPFLDTQDYPKTAYALLHTLRREIQKAESTGGDWRAILHQLRPETNAIWAGLPANERRNITRKLISYWNIHRHRIPPEILALLQKDMDTKALTIIPGTIYYIGGKNDGPLMVSYRKRGEDFIEYTAADYVINCSGPETDIARSSNPLLLKLRDKGIIHVGTLRMGLELTPSGRVRGKAPDIFHALGALVVGDKLESTAVPDIRVQASETAGRILRGAADEDYSRYYNYFI